MAKADGTDPRMVVPTGASGPIWSPTGTQIAYQVDSNVGRADIGVVDIPSGTVRTVVAGLQTNGPGLLGWSPTGDRILFAGLDQEVSSVWSINADGTDRKVLVPGADSGGWQPGRSARRFYDQRRETAPRRPHPEPWRRAGPIHTGSRAEIQPGTRSADRFEPGDRDDPVGL